jgi:hypothetical protein
MKFRVFEEIRYLAILYVRSNIMVEGFSENLRNDVKKTFFQHESNNFHIRLHFILILKAPVVMTFETCLIHCISMEMGLKFVTQNIQKVTTSWSCTNMIWMYLGTGHLGVIIILKMVTNNGH